ncbi:hypothetical protein [Rhizobium sullae]|uniref:hypothetical protein n=1 Tax=Rhizobium sullae TaxID=50338 RepID=UPI000B3551CB|nr:hypothetical protein [Rhizobium sullae]
MTYASRRWSNGLLKLVVATAAAGAPLPLSQATDVRAEDDPFGQFPLVIHCKYKDTYHAFYVSRISQDGLATYVASDRIAGTITLDGQAKAIGDEDGGSCIGKTLEELRASGQAWDLKQ